MPLTVRNREPNATVFGKVIAGESIRVLWSAAGHPDDTQRVPNTFAEDIDFLNAIDRGILEVISGPEDLMEALKRETTELAAVREHRAQVATTLVDRQADKSMTAQTCLGPAPMGRSGECGRTVLVLSKAAKDTPPLCPEHQALTPEFVLDIEGSKGQDATQSRDGEIRHVWTRVTLAPRVKGS